MDNFGLETFWTEHLEIILHLDSGSFGEMSQHQVPMCVILVHQSHTYLLWTSWLNHKYLYYVWIRV